MKKIIYFVLISPLLLIGCSMMDNNSNKTSQSVPEEMPASKYVGQGFQPKAEKSAIEYAKKHRKEYEKLGEQFFKDNFSLNVKATNVVGSGDGVEVFVHCDDHDIVFNASIPFDKESIHEKGSMRSHDNGDSMSTMVSTVLSGFEYRYQKEKYDNLYKFFDNNKEKYQYTGFTKQAINDTQKVGYQNKYFYISAAITSLSNYRKYYEPLINKNNNDFREGMREAYSSTNYEAKTDVVSTLFSTKNNFTKNNSKNEVIDLSNDLYKYKNKPNNTTITLQLSKPTINTRDGFYDHNQPLEYGVHQK
ncbi:DUF1672 domain-containing protein [Staphylococcus caprae]|uniref:DUF1672 domain-containing protein n=1 Tax=Staphylococcus caprae TaxID=29380 RepID=UPI001F58E8D2|nr:DUF1672 domain-containing protein [Staphylococcus caprae]MCI2956035.1 DUF1672 domain-containing protein [Staphylococcus caprae]